jgi:hypothetical protein
MEAEYGGRFTDLRLGLFTVEEGMASCLTRGWSLLQWKNSLNFCSKCGQPLGELECSVIPLPSATVGILYSYLSGKRTFGDGSANCPPSNIARSTEVVYHIISLEHIVL